MTSFSRRPSAFIRSWSEAEGSSPASAHTSIPGLGLGRRTSKKARPEGKRTAASRKELSSSDPGRNSTPRPSSAVGSIQTSPTAAEGWACHYVASLVTTAWNTNLGVGLQFGDGRMPEDSAPRKRNTGGQARVSRSALRFFPRPSTPKTTPLQTFTEQQPARYARKPQDTRSRRHPPECPG